MSYPTYYISSSVINVDTSTTPKILMLPTSSTIEGVPLIIRDSTGMADTHNIWISTQQFDLMDNFASTIRLSNSYQSFKVVPYSTTRYAITVNYTNGLVPFSYAVVLGYNYTQRDSSRSWASVASSSSGTVLAAGEGFPGGEIYVSTDSGASWTVKTSLSKKWFGLAMSSTGTYMLGAANGSYLYTSSNSGTTWTQRDSTRNWANVFVSSDGSIMYGIPQNINTTTDYVYVSTDYGVTWTPKNSLRSYWCGAMSSNGSVMYVGSYVGYIYVSTDTGNTWSQVGSSTSWRGMCCSSDGVIAYASDGNQIYKSTNTGSSWSVVDMTNGVRGPVCSSDGSIVVGANGYPGYIAVSSDGGTTFTQTGTSGYFGVLAINSSGSQILTGVNPGYLYTGQLSIL